MNNLPHSKKCSRCDHIVDWQPAKSLFVKCDNCGLRLIKIARGGGYLPLKNYVLFMIFIIAIIVYNNLS